MSTPQNIMLSPDEYARGNSQFFVGKIPTSPKCDVAARRRRAFNGVPTV
jgi:hypothetical protein